MTVAMGLVCSDGVLVAADSMGSAQRVSVHAQKVQTCSALPMVWTAAGSIYVIEEVEKAIRDLDRQAAETPKVGRHFADANLESIRTQLEGCVRPVMKRCYENALLPQTAYQAGQHPFRSDFLFLGWSQGTPFFLEFSGDGQLNWHTSRKFGAVGSGFEFATVASALLTNYLEGEPLTVDLGLQLAWRTIDTVCEVSTALVGRPVQLAVVDENGPRVLDQSEVVGVKESVLAWKQIEAETLSRQVPEATAHEPESPPSIDDEDE